MTLIKNKLVKEFPYVMVPSNEPDCYHMAHVLTKDKGKTYGLFAGRLDEGDKTNVIIHYDITDLQVLCLQYVLSVDPKPKFKRMQLVRIISLEDAMMMKRLSELVHESVDLLRLRLNIDEKIDLEMVCVANAYVMSRCKHWSLLISRAKYMKAVEFVPLCIQVIKEEREEARNVNSVHTGPRRSKRTLTR